MNKTPNSNRINIVLVGRRNAGKSSLINAITNQDIALVSSIPGTTTDPVVKSMELLPLGPVIFTDTAGIDDVGELGGLRIEKTKKAIRRADLILWVIGNDDDLSTADENLIEEIKSTGIPIIGVINKIDLNNTTDVYREWFAENELMYQEVSCVKEIGINELKEKIVEIMKEKHEPYILKDIVKPGEFVVLVIPIDSAAPKGRIILPQVQVLREILDIGAMGICVKETELEETLDRLNNQVALVITDSQAFNLVAEITPEEIPLTSFSILYARYKGDIEELITGANSIELLQPGDNVLISEGCTHHRQEDDIGKRKIPHWLENKVGGKLNFTWSSGIGYPEDIEKFKLIVHCGACMLNRREVMYRIKQAQMKSVPIVNYGVLIAYLQGILPRVIEPFENKEEFSKIW